VIGDKSPDSMHVTWLALAHLSCHRVTWLSSCGVIWLSSYHLILTHQESSWFITSAL